MTSHVFNYILTGALPAKTDKKETINLLYPTGNIYERIDLKNGIKHGITTVFTPSGDLWSQSGYINGVLEGTVYKWYPSSSNGTSQQIEEETNYTLGKKHGVYRKWYPLVNGESSSRLWIECTYFKDKLHSWYTEYNQDGSICTHTEYTYGEVAGLHQIVKDEYKNIPFNPVIKISSPKLKMK